MSWTDELVKIYEYNCGREYRDNEPAMLPVSHSTANAQIEITIDELGDFISASAVEKANAQTIIPVTEASGARSSNPAPMPFADKLVYIAGDYGTYVQGKRADNSNFFLAYKEQLEKWRDSEYSHKALKALSAYIDKREIMSDLINSGVLKLNSETGKLEEKVKIAGIAQEDSFVRFIVNYKDLIHENKTWLDKSLYDSFVSFISSSSGVKQLCYATGKEFTVTYKHPSKIRNSGDKAKLFSANDDNGFTYRGRFSNKEEAVSISYDFSQKLHNALKWLIAKQGMNFDSMVMIVWASAMSPIPDIYKSLSDEEDFGEDDTKSIPDTMPIYMSNLKKYILGYKQDFTADTKVMIMGFDAATTGRLSISIYDELMGSQFLENVENWHRETAWLRYNVKLKKSIINSSGIQEIIRCSFATEQNEKLVCDKTLMKDNVLRIIPCITNGKKLPNDIVTNLYNKASNPMAYKKTSNHRTVVEVACAMIRKNYIDNKKGDISMSYDPNIKDRSYLYGCLLAIADKAESDTYEKGEKDSRITNARRYWNAFSSRPYQTWQIIEERLRPYMDKLGGKSTYYEKLIEEITEKMEADAFSDNSRLDPLYLLGYHHFTAKMYKPTTNKSTEEE